MAKGAGPVFVVGSQGSGSTLLRLMLDSHPDLAIPQETGFMRLVMAHRWVPYWRFGDQWWRRLDLSQEDLDANLRRFYGGLFEQYAAGRGKSRWGDKTPFHVWHMDAMAQLFPDAAFVGIVRHPAATVASLIRRFDHRPRRAVRHWVNANRQLAAAGAALGARFTLLRYEDLVAHPEPTMRALLDWLREPWSDAVLHHDRVQPAQGAPRLAEGRTRTDEPIDASRAQRWDGWLDEPTRRLVDDQAGGWAAFFGYTPHTAVPVEAWTAADGTAAYLLDGDALAQRRRDRGGALPLNPPRPPWRDRPLVHARRRGSSRPAAPEPGPGAAAVWSAIDRLPPRAVRAIRDLRRRPGD